MRSHAAIDEEHFPQLVHQVRSGSPEALGELYVAFAEEVFAAAHRILSLVADAEDVTGEVFLGLSVTLGNYDHTSIYGFRRWLEKITVRRAAAHANCPAAAREVPLNSVGTRAGRSDRPIDRLALEGALATLPPALRTVVELTAVEGYSHHEISAMLGIGVGASRVRLHRARKKLHSLLGAGT